MTFTQTQKWLPLLVPCMPSPQELMPWLERMHMARHYSNFGPLVLELEAAFAQQFGSGVEQITSVANATQGLELVLQALNLPAGSHVLVPALTFVATATAVVRAGHVPVLADVDAQTWMITPEIARAVCERMCIGAVLPVATFGMPQDMHAWQQFELDTNVPVVVDAAAAYGSQWLRDAQGTLVFSLHTTKSLPAGEGGLVVSTRPGLAAKVRQLSNFGINFDPNASMPIGTLAGLGSNAKMSEYHAAIALVSLQKMELHAMQRRRLQKDFICEINQATDHRVAWQVQGTGGPLLAPTLLCASLPNAAVRFVLEQACQREHIMTRRWYQPLLQNMDVLQQRCLTLETPIAIALAQKLLGLPFFLGMTQEERHRVCNVIASAMSVS
ncbi:DegT/DnrJ/EryC1/StrS aminotransferase family protein [Comamonas sp.]|uniref:DegT/DnrJ/EryC1/StrS family aminotransferase n=1 Tax=Comamonas sp. TaxID=34028 RepID=UPI00258FFD98|nr:DegT/DnrJ/EryC1/StrS aminotransferase family protein [Comamonas sp.]